MQTEFPNKYQAEQAIREDKSLVVVPVMGTKPLRWATVAGSLGYGWFDGVQSDLAAENYASRAVDIAACSFDAPHIRNRLAWIAHREAMDDTAGARCGAGESAAVAPVRDGTRGEQSQRRNGDGLGLADADSGVSDRGPEQPQRRPEGRAADGQLDARRGTDAASNLADGDESVLRPESSAGQQPQLQHHARNHGEGASASMVDASIERRGQGRSEAGIQRGRSAVAGANVRERQGDMVNAEGIGCGPGLRQGGPVFDWPIAADATRGPGDNSDLGDAAGPGREGQQDAGRREEHSTRRPDAERAASGDGGRDGALADTDTVGQQISPAGGQPAIDGPLGHHGAYGRNGSFWADAEWLICHDGKARRAKPGIRLLADGAGSQLLSGSGAGDRVASYLDRLAKEAKVKSPSLRIPLWRTAGNSIVGPLFAEVLAAYMEAYPCPS